MKNTYQRMSGKSKHNFEIVGSKELAESQIQRAPFGAEPLIPELPIKGEPLTMNQS